MEQVIAIILVLIMVILDYYQPEKFTNFTTCINGKASKVITPTKSIMTKPCTPPKSVCSIERFTNKKLVWVFNDYRRSSLFWTSFGSRNNNIDNISLVSLCIDTITKHFNPQMFTVKIISQDSLDRLIPEHKQFLEEAKNPYIYYNFVKYAILSKYGGIWVPKDTIILKNPISLLPSTTGMVKTFAINNINNIDNRGYSDNVLSVEKGNNIIGKMVEYLIANLNTFQNSFVFKNSVNKYFNSILADQHIHKAVSCEFMTNNRHISNSTFFMNNPEIVDFDSKELISLELDHLKEFHKFDYILKMNKNEILNLDLFLGQLYRKSLQ